MGGMSASDPEQTLGTIDSFVLFRQLRRFF
jgi:hypothetical protein